MGEKHDLNEPFDHRTIYTGLVLNGRFQPIQERDREIGSQSGGRGDPKICNHHLRHLYQAGPFSYHRRRMLICVQSFSCVKR